MKNKHKHFDIIIAWASGEIIEYFDEEVWDWVECRGEPVWNIKTEYRIKDKYPGDIVEFKYIPDYESSLEEPFNQPNVKFVYDGVTKKLIQVEMIADKEW